MPQSYVDDDELRILTLTRINSLLALRARGTWQGARNATRKNKATISTQIKELEERFGYNIITPDSYQTGAVVLTPAGERLAVHCEVIKHRTHAIRRDRDGAPVSVVGLPHHDQLVIPLVARLGDRVPLVEHFLDEHQRASFENDAVTPLVNNVYDLVIGLPPERHQERTETLTTVTLYEPRLEAMLPKTYQGDSISLATLATEHQLNVPAANFRSRALLEDGINTLNVAVPPAADRVRLESHMTKNLVRYGWHRIGVPVLPSDIALAWKEDGECAGVRSQLFKWVPVLLHGKPLTHKVNATIRTEDDRIEAVFQNLLDIAGELRGRLEGTSRG